MPNGDITDAKDFFAFYIKGVDIPSTAPRSFPGIRRRVPAVVSQAPEYDAVPDSDDGTLQTDSGLLADAQNVVVADAQRLANAPLPPSVALDPARCVLRDICGLEDVIVQASTSPSGYDIVFLWCTDYPSSQFPNDAKANPRGAQPSDGAGRVFTLNASEQSELVIAECITRFREFVGASLMSSSLTARTVAFSFELLSEVRSSVASGSL